MPCWNNSFWITTTCRLVIRITELRGKGVICLFTERIQHKPYKTLVILVLYIKKIKTGEQSTSSSKLSPCSALSNLFSFKERKIIAFQGPDTQPFCGNKEKLLTEQELKTIFLLIQLLSNLCG